MLLLRCTKKLQKEIGLEKVDILEPEPLVSSVMGSWHVNLVLIDRKKCVVFVNDQTRFNFIIPGLSRAEIRQLSIHFMEHLQHALSFSGISLEIQARIINDCKKLNIVFANTNDKRMLGTLKKIIDSYKNIIHHEGGIQVCNIPEIINRLNHMPFAAIQFKFTSEVLIELYDTDMK